jgi:hypothetical protein
VGHHGRDDDGLALAELQLLVAHERLHRSLQPDEDLLGAVAVDRKLAARLELEVDDCGRGRPCGAADRERDLQPGEVLVQVDGNPAPDVAALDLRDALRALYDWYEQTEGPVTLFARDAYRYPEIWAEWLRVLDEIADRLARPLGRRRIVRAAAGHAVAFETWQSLVRHQGVSNAQAADAMVAFIHSV